MFIYLTHYLSKIFILTQLLHILTRLLQCGLSKLPKFFVFLKIFIVSRHSHLNAAFQFLKKNICDFQFFCTLVNFATVQMFLLSQAFIVSNIGKSCHIFENIQIIFNFLCLWICEQFIFLLSHSLTTSHATLKKLIIFQNVFKFSRY